ncbi:Diadenosine hexaphosphate hydrolase [compost metagenome]
MKRESARGIIIIDGGVALIHRIKEKNGVKEEYYVFPGGGLELGENYEQAAIREVYEELGINVEPIKILYRLERDESIHYFILCEYLSGNLGTGEGPEFNSEDYKDSGEFIPEIVPINQLGSIKFRDPIGKIIQNDIESNIDLTKIEYKDITDLLK